MDDFAPGSGRGVRCLWGDYWVCAGYEDKIGVVRHGSTMTVGHKPALVPIELPVDNYPIFTPNVDVSLKICG
ncbi:hypothetical protein CCASEI_01930 [Corynebacterium casei LMG S-19264]|uniref:Uncharacterized protein n=1 Tax=Corynebacterium casei LMG S-19264 TaxID=1285583 RepID=A0ABM5PM59_9CORY|nr:hypothetical protein CCASEI_01930 [Corynebacterium casei LMG S-19264]